MLRVGLTGNMGSGKSTVASVFRCLGVPVYQADEAAKRMYLRDDVLEKAAAIAGGEIRDSGGNLNHRALAALVFPDPDKLKALNALIHPLVREDFGIWSHQCQLASYIVHEAAILFESGFATEFDRVIHVSCPEDEAVRRIVARDGLSPEEIRQRMKHQIPDPAKCALSDFTILNDGTTLVIPQILRVHETLSKRSA